MARLRWLATTLALPLAYLAAVYLATRPPKGVFVFPAPTVMTVSDKPGPLVLHAPPMVYPPQALRKGVEGSVKLALTIAADGTVARANAVAGPKALRAAAVDNVRRWQFEAKAQEAEIETAFSIASATHSVDPPEPVRRFVPRYRGRERGLVRVVATVNAEGRVESVQPVTGPADLVPPAVDSVTHWKFRPMMRDGKPERGTAVVDVPFGL